ASSRARCPPSPDRRWPAPAPPPQPAARSLRPLPHILGQDRLTRRPRPSSALPPRRRGTTKASVDGTNHTGQRQSTNAGPSAVRAIPVPLASLTATRRFWPPDLIIGHPTPTSAFPAAEPDLVD